MFEIERDEQGRVLLSGRLDASQVDKARSVMSTIEETCTVDFSGLEYISSAGLGILLETQKRLMDLGHGLTLTGLSRHISDLFHIAGFDSLFDVQQAPDVQ